MFKFVLSTIIIFSSIFIYGQNTKENHKEHKHSKGEINYHCSGCDHHLFSEQDIIKEEGESHYHVLSSDSIGTKVYCAGCNAYLGSFNDNKSIYKIQSDHLKKSDISLQYNCASCGTSVFNENKKVSSDNRFSYFSKPIKKNRVYLKQTDFYKIEDSNVLCKNCGKHLGQASGKKNERFGIRINLNSVFKK